MDTTGIRPGLIANPLQQHMAGTIVYPTKDSPWQQVMTPLTILAATGQEEIPKESIIANTDFTTTSVIAKRRLSSKKRKKQSQEHGGSDGTVSPNTQSPFSTSPQDTPNSTHSSAFMHQPVVIQPNHPLQPPAAAMATQGGVVVPTSIVAGTHYIPVGIAQSNQVLGQLPPEMAYQLFHDRRHLQQHAQSQQLPPTSSMSFRPIPPVQNVDGRTTHPAFSSPVSSSHVTTQNQGSPDAPPSSQASDFRWCNAHVFIAKRIQEHQKQESKTSHQTHTAQVLTQQHIEALHQQQLLQQQQQLAMLQMYGCLSAATPMTNGLHPQMMALHKDQLHPLQLQGQAVPIIQNISRHPSGQVLGTLPVSSVYQPTLVSNEPTLVQTQNGSWVAPVPIIGSCVVNPIQPGLLASSMVK